MRKKKYQDYDFEDITYKGIEKDVDTYLNDNVLSKKMSAFFEKVFFFYDEKTNLRPKEQDAFIEHCIQRTLEYNAYEEVSYYYFLKRGIEEKYNLVNKKFYFGVEQEAAFRLYLKSNDEQRKDIIYNKFLYNAFSKIIENVIHVNQLYSKKESYDDMHASTLAFLHEKMGNFDVSLNKKAYSFFTVISIRYLQNALRKENVNMQRNLSFEDTYDEFSDDERLSYKQEMYGDVRLDVDFFYELPAIIEEFMNDERLCEKDMEIGQCLIYLLNNWKDVFNTSGHTTKKFDKNTIYQILRNMTGCETKDITRALKLYKEMYYSEKFLKVEKEYNPFDEEI